MTELIGQHYHPGTALVWRGRSDNVPDSVRYHEAIRTIDMRTHEWESTELPRFAFLGFCSDTGVRRNQGRPGAAEGPRELRNALSQFPVPTRPDCLFYDVGDVTCVDDDLEAAQEVCAQLVAELLQEGIHPILLGGGHEIAWAHYLGIQKAGLHRDLGILNFDAHFDLRPLQKGLGTSGTSFLQIANARSHEKLDFSYTCIGIQRLGNTPALYQAAAELGVRSIEADALHLQDHGSSNALLDDLLSEHKHIMLSVCMDVFGAAYAPGVSAPQPLGLTPWHVMPLLERLAKSKKVIGMHVAELAPSLDHQAMTSRLAAALIAGFVSASRLD